MQVHICIIHKNYFTKHVSLCNKYFLINQIIVRYYSILICNILRLVDSPKASSGVFLIPIEFTTPSSHISRFNIIEKYCT